MATLLCLLDTNEQVLTEFRFGQDEAKIFSGVGEERRVFDLNPDSGFSYKSELKAFFARRATDKQQRQGCSIV